MPSEDDLKVHATSTTDFYALLSVPATATDSEIRTAYRRTSLKYHPDKVGATPANLEKFHLLQIANDVLSDPTVRALYDQAREARERRKVENEKLEGRRREMKEALERREKGGASVAAGVKRGWGAREETEEEKLEREIKRIAAENRRKMAEMNEKRRMERERLEQERRESDSPAPSRRQPSAGAEPTTPAGQTNGMATSTTTADAGPKGGTSVPELDRSIKVRFPRNPDTSSELDVSSLTNLLSRFGKIENVFMLKDKKKRMSEINPSSPVATPNGGKEKKVLMATGVVVFTSIVSAHHALEDFKRRKGEWGVIEGVDWSSGVEPKFDFPKEKSVEVKVGSSIPAATTATPKTTPGPGSGAGPGFGANSPSLMEMTMIKLKNAQREKEERKRLAVEIARREAEEEAAAAMT